MSNKTQPSKVALKVLKTLDVLTNNFAHGFTPKELVQATGFDNATITIHLTTLIEAGYAEVISETDRCRPSVRFAQKAVRIAGSINSAMRSMEELNQRINTER